MKLNRPGNNPAGIRCNVTIISHKNLGSGVLNPGVVFLRFVKEAFFFFLTPAGQSLTFN